jgi:alpha-mannosidase
LVAVVLPVSLIAWADPPVKTDAHAKLTVVTTSAHCDWSWGHSRAWHEERYAEIIHNVLLLMRQYPSYTWQLENENEELAPFLKKAAKQWPGMIDEFWQRVREGRIEVIVAISDPRLTEVYPETIVRNIVLGKEYFRRHVPGIEQKVYNAVDLMCGSSQMPQILAQAGYRYFVFSRPCDKKVVFWRKGLDGTRMINVCQHYGYEGPEVKGLKLQSHSGDDILPNVQLAEAAETWDKRSKILGTSIRYLEELERRGGPEIELEGVLDSLECLCEGSVHGSHNLYCMNNRNEDLLLSVEKAQVMASTAGHLFPKARMDAAWHDLLSCVGHAILYCWTPDYEERLAKAAQTQAEGQKALRDAVEAVAAAVRFRADLGKPVVVFNFHAWPTSGPVEVVLPGGAEWLSLHDPVGNAVPWQRVGEPGQGGQRVAFLAQNVPACGYKTFYLRRADAGGAARPELRRGPGPVQTDHYRARLLPGGALEIIDRQRGAVLGAPKVGGLGDVVFYDAPKPTDWELSGPLGPRHAWDTSPQEFQVAEGPVYVSLIAKGTFGPHRVVREVRLARGSRRIDYLVEIDASDGCGVFCIRFPTGLQGRVFAGIPFGAEPRENFAREPFRGEYFVKGYPDGYHATRWTDLSTSDFGYTLICPPGAPTGYFYKAADQALEFMFLRVRPMPQGVWGQVHPFMQGKGHHAWRCALVPHQGSWREAASYRDAMELHAPLTALVPSSESLESPGRNAASTGRRLDDAGSLIEVTPANIVLSAMRLLDSPDRSTPEWELRLYETIGQSAEVTLRVARPVQSVRATNFLGEPSAEAGKIETSGREIRLQLKPWKIVTLRGQWAKITSE